MSVIFQVDKYGCELLWGKCAQPQWSLGIRVLLDDLQDPRVNDLPNLPLAKKGQAGHRDLGPSICPRPICCPVPRAGPMGDSGSQAQVLPQLGPVLALDLGD